MTTTLILNSAQSRYPRGDDPWVQATIRAIDRICGNGAGLITSTDPLMWDFVTFLAAERGLSVRHIVPEYDANHASAMFHDTLQLFGISKENAQHIPMHASRSLSRAGVWQYRDRLAVQSADVVIPVCIHPGGRLDSLLTDLPDTTKLDHEFQIPWQTGKKRVPRYNFSSCPVSALPAGDWLIHWTRTTPGPWQDESPAGFFRDMLAYPAQYVRSARETLVRIIHDRQIQASQWKIPGSFPVVSLTENTPETAVTLMKWRKRFVRYTYEPYGIAIRKEVLAATGALPVRYETRAGNPSSEPVWRFQSPGIAADWTREHEWRHPGDIDLSSVDPGDWFAIVPAKSDVAFLEHRCTDTLAGVFVLFRT